MEQITVGQVWEIYSSAEVGWIPAVVTHIDPKTVRFRCQRTDREHDVSKYKLECYPGLYRLEREAAAVTAH